MKEILSKKNLFVLAIILGSLTSFRLLIWNASFPFFNNVDEHAHFDLIVKYALGQKLNSDTTLFEVESSRFIILYGSPEYLARPENYQTGEIPNPLWSFELEEKKEEINLQMKEWTAKKNHEVFSPPIYYTLLGGWFNLGKLIGIEGGYLLYWLRTINIFVYLSIFWITFYFALKVFPENFFMQFGILVILTVFPQDVFFGLNSDNLSPLFSLLAITCIIEIYHSNQSYFVYLLAGLFIAAAFLVKISNFPLLFVAGIFLLLHLRNRYIEVISKILILFIACFLPISIWLSWNYINLGDLTGTADKIHYLGWTKKSFIDFWDHPIFSVKGSLYLFSDLIKTFWRGELVWGMRVLASKNSDLFYLLSSIVFVFASMLNTIFFKSDYSDKHRFANIISTLYLLISILFIIILSMLYDFGKGFYPSKSSPFFTSGRLLLGVFIPFLILYLDGLRITAQRISKRINLLYVVIIFSIFISHYEIVSLFMIIKSKYNFFHL